MSDKQTNIVSMFNQIASTYDRANRVLSFGIDTLSCRWWAGQCLAAASACQCDARCIVGTPVGHQGSDRQCVSLRAAVTEGEAKRFWSARGKNDLVRDPAGLYALIAASEVMCQRRKFIIADTPGHVQYTRNMVTGASTANAAIILIDARHGVIEQTLRHAFIASLLQIPHVIVCVNKMDLVDYRKMPPPMAKWSWVPLGGVKDYVKMWLLTESDRGGILENYCVDMDWNDVGNLFEVFHTIMFTINYLYTILDILHIHYHITVCHWTILSSNRLHSNGELYCCHPK